MAMKVQSPHPPPPSLAFEVFSALAGLLTTAFAETCQVVSSDSGAAPL